MLDEARALLPDLFAVGEALDDLKAVCDAFPAQNVHIDLSELRVDHYHTGLLYAAYGSECHDAVARGGRYDGLGEYFGRARPATGFSFDLRTFIGRLPSRERMPVIAVAKEDVLAARETVEKLRAEGHCVVIDYGIVSNSSGDIKSRLVAENGNWVIVSNT